MSIRFFNTLMISWWALFSLVSCESKEAITGSVQIEDYQVMIATFEDIGDDNNPGDIEVSIAPPKASDLISEYRLYYELSSSILDLEKDGLAVLNDLDPTHFTSISPDRVGEKVRLKVDQVSIDAESMKPDGTYVIYGLSIGTFNGDELLAVAKSTELTMRDATILDSANYRVGIIEAEDLRNSGNSSDFTISFNRAPAHDNISQYWIVASKASSNITIDQARSLDDRQIHIIDKPLVRYIEELPKDFLDIDGDSLITDLEYQFYILTQGEFNNEGILVLSDPSEPISLIQKTEVSTLVSGYRGNGSITLDADGNIYVNEFGAGSGNAGLGTSAFKITPEGDVEEFVSNLSGPVGNTLDADGNYYVNNGNEGDDGDFLRISPDGSQTVVANIKGYPTNILAGSDGFFYIADWVKPLIHKVSTAGVVTSFASDERLAGCTGITYDDQENILVGNFSSGKIMSLDKDGTITEIATIPTVVENFVIGYIAYFEENIYATGYGSNIIYRISLDGTIDKWAGDGTRRSLDGELDKSSFMIPNGIAIDKQRRILYISENALGNPTNLRVIPLD